MFVEPYNMLGDNREQDSDLVLKARKAQRRRQTSEQTVTEQGWADQSRAQRARCSRINPHLESEKAPWGGDSSTGTRSTRTQPGTLCRVWRGVRVTVVTVIYDGTEGCFQAKEIAQKSFVAMSKGKGN